MYIYPRKRNVDALLKVGVIINVVVFRTLCCVVTRIALATDWLLLLLLVNTSCALAINWWHYNKIQGSSWKCLISCSPGMNRWYRVIGIFLTISPVRDSNRRYSSIIENRDLLHNYFVVPITTHTHVRRKSIDRKKIIERQKKEKGYYIPIEDHPVSSRSRRSLLLSVVGNIYGCYY